MSDLDLAAFLRERLNEDEQAERAAVGSCWHECEDGDLAFHERFDAARVLREIQAKRRILDEHQPGHPGPGGRPGCAVCDIGARSCGCMGSGHYPCLTVRLLALPYASHPEYRKEWRP